MRSYLGYHSDEAYREGRRDEEYGRRNYDYDEHSWNERDKAYYEGREDQHREDERRREERREEEEREERHQHAIAERRRYEREQEEEMYSQQQYPEQEYPEQESPVLGEEPPAEVSCDATVNSIQQGQPEKTADTVVGDR